MMLMTATKRSVSAATAFLPVSVSVSVRIPSQNRQVRLSSALSSVPPLIINEKPIHSIMAPMVAASDYPFRLLCRQHGVDLCMTQMMHARNCLKSRDFQLAHFDFIDRPSTANSDSRLYEHLLPSQQSCIAGMEEYLYTGAHHVEGGPLIVQLAGSEPTLMVDAAQLILDQAPAIAGIDVNLGCPQGIARKGKYGAFLMEQQEHVVMDILSALRRNLPEHVKVSAKIRLPANGSDDILKERMKKLMATGVDFVTIHGRTLHENKTLVGAAHLDKVRLAIDTCRQVRPNDFPIVANGGIEQYSDIQKVLTLTSASAIMSSEALLETPNVFSEPSNVDNNPAALFSQQLQFARDYLYYAAQHPPLPGTTGGSFNIVRGHLFKFLHRYMQPELRDKVAKLQSIFEALLLLNEFEEFYRNQNEQLLAQCTTSWYRRHWAANERVNSRKHLEPIIAPLEERKLVMQARIAKLKEQRNKIIAA